MSIEPANLCRVELLQELESLLLAIPVRAETPRLEMQIRAPESLAHFPGFKEHSNAA